MELKVKVLNVNDGHNPILMEQCRVLKEYAQYVARVRRYLKEMPLDTAVTQAVDECIHEGILADFLRKNRAEVIMVSIFEYDKELEEKKLREAEYQAGWQDGEQSGSISAALKIAVNLGLSKAETIQQLSEILNISLEEAEKIYKDNNNFCNNRK